MLSFHLNVLQSLMIVLFPTQQILFLMFVYHPFSPKITIFLRLFVPCNYSKARGYDDISNKIIKNM